MADAAAGQPDGMDAITQRITDDASLPGFVRKTWLILASPEYHQYISWSDRGDSIVVHQPAKFSSEVLPNFFKHRNFSSFVRQLNLYSFRKTGVDPSCREFKHSLFRRDRPDLLPQIKRRTRKKPKPEESTPAEPAGPATAHTPMRGGMGSRGPGTMTRHRSTETQASEGAGPALRRERSSGAGPQAAADWGRAGSAAAPPPSSAWSAAPARSASDSGLGGGAVAAAAAEVEKLRDGRRTVDLVLKKMVELSATQQRMEGELQTLRARDAAHRQAEDANRALQLELHSSRQRMGFLQRSVHQLYLLLWRMYSAFKASGWPTGLVDRPELDRLADTIESLPQGEEARPGVQPPFGADDGDDEDGAGQRAGASEALPSASPIATASDSSEPLALGSFSRGGAVPFQEARRHWRTVAEAGRRGRGGQVSKRPRDDAGPDAVESAGKRATRDEVAGMGSPRASPPMTDVVGKPPPAVPTDAPGSGEGFKPMLVPVPPGGLGPSSLGGSHGDPRGLSSAVASLSQAASSLADEQHVVMSTLASVEDSVRSAGHALSLPSLPGPPDVAARLGRGVSAASMVSLDSTRNAYVHSTPRESWPGMASRPGMSPPLAPALSSLQPASSAASTVPAVPAGAPPSRSASGLGPAALAPARGLAAGQGSRGERRLGRAAQLRVVAPPPAVSPPAMSRGLSSGSQASSGRRADEPVAGLGLDGFGAPSDAEPRSMLGQSSMASSMGADDAGGAEEEEEEALEAMSLGSLGSLDDEDGAEADAADGQA